jgi:hypothetical protein
LKNFLRSNLEEDLDEEEEVLEAVVELSDFSSESELLDLVNNCMVEGMGLIYSKQASDEIKAEHGPFIKSSRDRVTNSSPQIPELWTTALRILAKDSRDPAFHQSAVEFQQSNRQPYMFA